MIVSLKRLSVPLIETMICVALEGPLIRLAALIMAAQFKEVLVHTLKNRGKTARYVVRRTARSTKI
jgi:hypothetical protein